MPCNGGPLAAADEERGELRRELDRTTQLLCFLCGEFIVRSPSAFGKLPEALREWWREHQERDTDRVVRRMNEYIDNLTKIPTPERLAATFVKWAQKVHPVSSYHKKWFLNLAISAVGHAKNNKDKEVVRKALAKLTEREKRALGLTGKGKK